MKKILHLVLILLFSTAYAQTKIDTVDYHLHKGFHIELGVGPQLERIANGQIKFSGKGLGLDFKLGGALNRNLILTFDVLYKQMNSYDVYINDYKLSGEGNTSLSETTYGAGLTYYSTPKDYFCSFTIGMGTFGFYNGIKLIELNGNSNRIESIGSSHYGFSSQLKGGKHWWLSPTVGITLAAAYGFTSVVDAKQHEPAEAIINSSRFAVSASVNYH